MSQAGDMQQANACSEPLRECRHGLHDNCFIATQVAAMLLKRYKDKFSGNPLGATWGYLRQMARDSLPPNPLVSHDTQPSHLRDPAFLVKTLRYELMTLRHELVTLTLLNPLKPPAAKLSQYSNCTSIHASSAHIELTSMLRLKVLHSQAAVGMTTQLHRHALLTMHRPVCANAGIAQPGCCTQWPCGCASTHASWGPSRPGTSA